MKIQSPRRRSLAATSSLLLATAAVALAQAPQGAAATAGSSSTYIVLYNGGASSSGAASTVGAAGGTLVANYSQIGVVVARSATADFAARVSKAAGVSGVSRTDGFATRVGDSKLDSGTSAAVAVAAAGTADPLSGLQWDMEQIQAPAAHALNNGAGVLVGDIDTGLDYTHPDLAPNVDDAASANCVSGAAVPGKVAAMDDNGHGTHTAGTIAAAANGIGIVGVAPDVRIAGIKAGNADGFFFPQAVVCAFMWAGTHGVDVTNNSYFADPWLFNCKNDPGQRAIWTAERRAIQFAQKQGVTVVAAEGNQADDLSHPTQDATSPDDTTPVTRDISNACAVVPVEVPGVIGVTATGNKHLKSFYSSFGISTADVAAPGGDSRLQVTAAAPNGRVLSTWPASLMGGCLRPVVDASGATYCYAQGTSMASPHAAGVAALLASAHGLKGGALEAALQQGATPLSCPADTSAYDFFPAVDGGVPQTCQGGTGHNSWFGAGEVNALNAVK
jgi:lantibiotic leader peptide-processing serine protease